AVALLLQGVEHRLALVRAQTLDLELAVGLLIERQEVAAGQKLTTRVGRAGAAGATGATVATAASAAAAATASRAAASPAPASSLRRPPLPPPPLPPLPGPAAPPPPAAPVAADAIFHPQPLVDGVCLRGRPSGSLVQAFGEQQRGRRIAHQPRVALERAVK